MNNHSYEQMSKKKGVNRMAMNDVECCDFYQVHEDVVKAVNNKMPEEDELYDLAEIFKKVENALFAGFTDVQLDQFEEYLDKVRLNLEYLFQESDIKTGQE